MRRLVVAFLIVLSIGDVSAQTRRRTPTKAAPKKAAPTPPKREAAAIKCPTELGLGVKTKRMFCDVLTARDPTQGVLVPIPAHTGTATLFFDLHNRHTYSEEQVKAGKAFASYTATVGVLTMSNDLIARAVVQNEFRTAADLFDRVAGGAAPGGVKAVAPTGVESIVVTIPQNVLEVSILGEKLEAIRVEGREGYVLPGRPIATLSNVEIEYRPAPVRSPPRTKGR